MIKISSLPFVEKKKICISLKYFHSPNYSSDGRKPYPINHGPSSPETFIEDAARVCQEYMSRDPEEVRFTMMALAAED